MSPVEMQILASASATLGSSAAVAVGVWIAKELKIVKNRQKHSHFKQLAMDHALEKSIGNGYSKARETELTRLINEDVYIRTGE